MAQQEWPALAWGPRDAEWQRLQGVRATKSPTVSNMRLRIKSVVRMALSLHPFGICRQMKPFSGTIA